MENQLKHHELTGKIIGCFYSVYNTLGYGFIEKVYENSLIVELHKQGLDAIQQYPINVFYNSEIVGEYSADIVVDSKVILEIKAVKELADVHKVQIRNYLRATEYEVGLLLNFGPTPQKERVIFENHLKRNLNRAI